MAAAAAVAAREVAAEAARPRVQGRARLSLLWSVARVACARSANVHDTRRESDAPLSRSRTSLHPETDKF